MVSRGNSIEPGMLPMTTLAIVVVPPSLLRSHETALPKHWKPLFRDLRKIEATIIAFGPTEPPNDGPSVLQYRSSEIDSLWASSRFRAYVPPNRGPYRHSLRRAVEALLDVSERDGVVMFVQFLESFTDTLEFSNQLRRRNIVPIYFLDRDSYLTWGPNRAYDPESWYFINDQSGRHALNRYLRTSRFSARLSTTIGGDLEASSNAPEARAELDESRHWERLGASPLPNDVYVGVSAPSAVTKGEYFVARFAAYTEANRKVVSNALEKESPQARQRLDLDQCQWQPSAKVTVRLDVNCAVVSNAVQTFRWNGSWKLLRFDVTVSSHARSGSLVLRFEVAVEELPILSLRPEIELVMDSAHRTGRSQMKFEERRAPRSAFASYTTKDRREVLGRVRSVQISTGIDVFLDCLSLRPGEQWKARLRSEIENRDVFWLFWSRSAMKSEWVDWEWRTALKTKSLSAIQPHPLEPQELAPPPKELSDLQFGAMYEWYVGYLREPGSVRIFRRVPLRLRSMGDLMQRVLLLMTAPTTGDFLPRILSIIATLALVSMLFLLILKIPGY